MDEEPVDEAPMDEEPVHEGEPGRIPELEDNEPWETRADRFQRGNDFNEALKGDYDSREVRLDNGKVVDGYTPGEEIVSERAPSSWLVPRSGETDSISSTCQFLL